MSLISTWEMSKQLTKQETMQVHQLTNEQATLDASKRAIHQAVQY